MYYTKTASVYGEDHTHGMILITTMLFCQSPSSISRQLQLLSSTHCLARCIPRQNKCLIKQFAQKIAYSSNLKAQARRVRTMGTAKDVDDPVVQYVVVSRELLTEKNWSVGSIIAQAVHASVAAVWSSRDNETTNKYCEHSTTDISIASGINQMRTVVLQAKTTEEVVELGRRLQSAQVKFRLWKEEPESIITALATVPLPKKEVQDHFKGFKLFR